jgi:hypothetical protein
LGVGSDCALFKSIILVVDATGTPAQEPDANQYNEEEKETAGLFTLGGFGLKIRREETLEEKKSTARQYKHQRVVVACKYLVAHFESALADGQAF